jgi:soluble lytic murein transglycosylase-like protein
LVTQPADGQDAVRQWFLQSWQSLAPVLRRIGAQRPGQEYLLLLGVIASTDALAALDQLGPAIGLDISSDGLRRLARMIDREGGQDLLLYSPDEDPELQRLLNESLDTAPPPSAWQLDLSLFPRAMAASNSQLNNWVPSRDNLDRYLPQVAALLKESASTTIAGQDLDSSYRTLFQRLVLATAWQESCWRQYVVSDDRKLVPLRSSSGDVGLMQMNERVWRGFYSQQKLRWDIAYNSTAGTEVLRDYMMKYAIRKGEHRQPGGLTNVARAAYSAYNGGPSQVSRYRNPKAPDYGKKVDAAFWDKYQQVAAGNELAVSRCLGGKLTGTAGPKNPQGHPPRGKQAGGVAGQFTLQLGVFSSKNNAQGFITQNRLGGKARVQQRRRSGTEEYLVLYGSYATRDQAETAKQGLARLEPWVRQLDQL